MYIVKANDEIFEVNDIVFLKALEKVNSKDELLIINDFEKEIGEIEINEFIIFGDSIQRHDYENFNGTGKKRIALFDGGIGIMIDNTEYQTNQAAACICMPDNTMLLECIGKLSGLQKLSFIGAGITTLSENVGDLKNLKSLMLFGTKTTTLPECIGDLTGLKELDLFSTKITTLPESIVNLTGLEKLSLIRTKITTLPENIGDLIGLKELDLNDTEITKLPKSIGNLTGLEKLKLSRTKIKTLPENIGDLTGLKELDLFGTKITTLPESIVNLTGLEKLSLIRTKITTLPENIGDLIGLKELDLDDTEITTLPESIVNLNGLEKLKLSRTKIKTLPENIGDLTGLKVLDLGDTEITTLPESIVNLKGLKNLRFDGIEITTLPESIVNLTGLENLSLIRTKITTLPENIGDLTGLKDLYLDDTEIATLPESIVNLSGLENLSLIRTKITTLSESIGDLTGLKNLRLDGTDITKLPKSIVNLSGLENLSLIRTKITTLPENIGDLTGLKDLYLDDTEIATLPESIVNLSGLENLSLIRTKITTLSESIGNLTGLKNLRLDGTDITKLPKSIVSLNGLEYLSLSDTGITSLPENIDKLTGLKQLYLNNLYLDTIPRSCVREELYLSLDNTILSRQPKALFSLPKDQILTLYYDQERIPIREGKVIFLGESGVGKSHTIKRVMNYGKDEDYDLKSTPGIDINSFSCEDETGTKILFWDFGGQEIMQAMHQCFLTERTCYVVVVSNRDPQKAMSQARKWLRTVAGFSSQVSVILAVNQWNNVSEEQNIDKDELVQLCPRLSEIIFYTAKGGEADVFNQNLTNTIIKEVRKLDSVQLELPKSWAAIRENLMNSSQNYISLDEYRRICATYGLDKEDGATEEIRTWLLEWFNDMGVCFSYHKNAPMTEPELKNYKVLSPKWLTNGIYRIINNGIRFVNQGCLTLGEVNKLLNDPDLISVDKSLTYKKAEEQRYVLEIMRKYGRSFALEDGREYIPELLQGKRPSSIRPSNYTNAVLYTIKLKYLPQSLIHRLMIDLREWNDGVQWRYGVRLCDAETALLIESQDESGILTIEVFTQNDNEFCYLFHQTRLMIMGYIENMSLVLEEEQLSRNFNGSTAKQELYSLIWDYVEDPEAKITASTNTTGRRPVKVPIRDMLLLLFTDIVCKTAANISDISQCDLSPALNAVTAVYPYNTQETWTAVKSEENWISLIKDTVDLKQWQRSNFNLRLALLSLIALRDRSFLNWLLKKGTLKKEQEKMSDHNLEEKMLGGINEQIYRWAKTSPIYLKAVDKPDWDMLAKALGPEQETRCIASIALLNTIWHMHPELGLMPDYESLSKKEYGRSFYSKYRDHMTHMLKTYLLGLYLYENQGDLKMQLTEEDFFPTWTITALWHDIGYLIETEEGTKDGKDAKEAFDIITDSLSLPLCHLYPAVFKKDWETVKKDEKNNHTPTLRAFQSLREKLSLFNGYGKTVSLTEREDINPIERYLSEKAEIIVGRSYYDHGIVSAMMFLYMWDALQEYMEKACKYTNDDKKQNTIDDFRTKTTDYGKIVKQAATAVALHNLQKEENLDLSYQYVTLSDFCIPLSTEPYAWLLRVCDEMQCWDRQRFNSPTENKKPTLDGKSLFFEDGFLVVKDKEAYKKLHDSLEGIVDPYPSFLE